jgi:addiction module RelE/StbE family toxin
MKVEWTVPAETDLDELFDYIARDSAVYAEQFVDRVLESVARLSDQPKMGRAVPEADSDNIRELVFRKNYRIIYVLRTDRIQILAIIHAARDLESAQSKPWDVI